MARSTFLITGGAGFIGSSLIAKIIETHRVICVDNFNDFYSPDWKHQNLAPFLQHPHFSLHELDITDNSKLTPLFETHKIDKIVHLAARAGVRPSIEYPLLYEEVNVRGTLTLLELARQYRIPQFVFASSSSVYGEQPTVPFSESDPVNHPISPYAATKKAGEMLCYTYAHLYGIPMTCLRFFTVYGPKGRPDMAPYLFVKAVLEKKPIIKFGDGSSSRDYTYIDDIVTGIIATMQKPFPFEIFNLGNHTPTSLNDFIALIEKVTQTSARIQPQGKQPGDVTQTYADISKAKQLLGWQPHTSLEKGLSLFVDWYQKTRL